MKELHNFLFHFQNIREIISFLKIKNNFKYDSILHSNSTLSMTLNTLHQKSIYQVKTF